MAEFESEETNITIRVKGTKSHNFIKNMKITDIRKPLDSIDYKYLGCVYCIVLYSTNFLKNPLTHNIHCLQEFTVNKEILLRSNSVFQAMFNSGLQEAQSKEILITDISVDGMEYFLRYLHTGELCTDYASEIEFEALIKAADKYLMPEKSSLAKKLYDKYFGNPKTLWLFYIYKDFFKRQRDSFCKELKKILEMHTEECLNFDANEEFVLDLVKSESLSLNNETEVIKFVNNWAKQKLCKEGRDVTDSNIRKLLERNILKYLRFLTLRREEFHALIDGDATWLTGDEKYSIIRQLDQKEKYQIFPTSLSSLTTKRCSRKFLSVSKYTTYSGMVRFSTVESANFCTLYFCHKNNCKMEIQSLTVVAPFHEGNLPLQEKFKLKLGLTSYDNSLTTAPLYEESNYPIFQEYLKNSPQIKIHFIKPFMVKAGHYHSIRIDCEDCLNMSHFNSNFPKSYVEVRDDSNGFKFILYQDYPRSYNPGLINTIKFSDFPADLHYYAYE